jgi:predicted phosphodiesterase
MVGFGDLHIPYHDPLAVSVVLAVIKLLKPDLVICLGDLLDCSQFSVHPATYDVPETEFEDDLDYARSLLDAMHARCDRLVMVEGNHEYRIDRWAARTQEGRGAYSLIAPRIQLSKTAELKPRKKWSYVRYGNREGKYPHYKINSRIVAVHGWSYAIHATKNHLKKSQGMSILHGHTHRKDSTGVQHLWIPGRTVDAMSCGCLCQKVPLWCTSSPVEWVNMFLLGYLGSHSEEIYPITIRGDHCILPDGRRVDAGKV